MAKGKTHDFINLGALFLIIGLLFLLEIDKQAVLLFSLGYILSTLLFSPDTDILPKKRALFLRPLLFPYSLLFKHRGISHHIVFGTLTRLLYLAVLIYGFLVIAASIKKGEFTPLHYQEILAILRNHQSYSHHLVWFLSGFYCGDLFHILTDWASSFLKKLL